MAVATAAVLAGTASAAGPKVAHTATGNARAGKSIVSGKIYKGWTATKSTSKGVNLSCPGYVPSGSGVVEIGSAGSPNYASTSEGPFVLQQTSVYATAGQASTLWSRAVKAGLIACVAQSLDTIKSKGITVKLASEGALKVTSVGDKTAGYRVAATLSSAKQKALKTYFDVVLVQVGNAITEFTFSSLVSPVPAKVEYAFALLAARNLGASGAPVA